MSAFNDWYHVNANTYGTWLPGDPRGWRERGHRKHCEGDYRNPPPKGSGDKLHQYAQRLLAKPPVHLDTTQQVLAGRAMVEMLLEQNIELLALCLDEIHFHLLARFPDTQVRPVVGRAKKHAWHALVDHGFEGKLWQDGSKVTPIGDRRHQLNVFRYITRHGQNGAWLWTFRDEVDRLDDDGR